MLGAIHQYDILIKEHHLDVFGHVNNAVYLELLEEARWDLIVGNGYGYDHILKTGLGPTILDVHLVFKREIKNRQRVRVLTWLDSYEQKIAHIGQKIVGENDKVHCEASFTVGLFDLAARRLVDPTPDWWRAMGISPPEPTTRS